MNAFYFSEKWPENFIIEICNEWMESRSQLMPISGPNLLLGLARWTILHPVIRKVQGTNEEMQYAQLHLAILETIADMKSPIMVSNKYLIALISKLEEVIGKSGPQCDLGSQQELALDRLGQILHCLTSTKCVQGNKITYICQSLKKLKTQNKMLQMYLQRYT